MSSPGARTASRGCAPAAAAGASSLAGKVAPGAAAAGAAVCSAALRRSRSAASDPPPAFDSDADDSDDAKLGTVSGNQVAADAAKDDGGSTSAAALRLANAVYSHAKPLMATHLKEITTKFECKVVQKMSEVLSQTGEMAKLFRCLVREELDSHLERQPKMDAITNEITKAVTAAVFQVVKTTPQKRTLEQMSRPGVTAAVIVAVGYRKVRVVLPEILRWRIRSLA